MIFQTCPQICLIMWILSAKLLWMSTVAWVNLLFFSGLQCFAVISSFDVLEAIPENELEKKIEKKPKELLYAEPLKPEQIRWFYRDDVNKRWMEFCGYDSLKIEYAWRVKKNIDRDNLENNCNFSPESERIIVRGGMYDVELESMKCVSIYCPGEELL